MGAITVALIWPLILAWKIMKLVFRFAWPGIIVNTGLYMAGYELSLQQFQVLMIASIPVALFVEYKLAKKHQAG